MITKTAFQELYRKLNPRQKEAVDAIEGPVMVVAGPGTGKTQILALRIANILRKTDTPPDAILAISFTESAAMAMRARVVALVGDAGYRVQIHTFHSFCNTLIQQYPEEFPDLVGASPISDIERSRMIAQIIENGNFHMIRPFGNPTHYVRAVGTAIHTLKRENIDADAYIAMATQEEKEFLSRDDIYHSSGKYAGEMKGIAYTAKKKIEKNKELAEVYRLYEKQLREHALYDFDDMIMKVAHVWRSNRDFLRSIQERFLYFLIDEHQDTNNAQNAIIEMLSDFDDRPNLFLVGDEKQAIFRFQGASFENFMRMKEKYPDMRVIVLEENYRSTQYILDASHGIGERITKNPIRLRAHVSSDLSPIRIEAYHDGEQEVIGIISSIQKRIHEGINPGSIAILYRENKDALAFAHALKRAGIPFVVESDHDVFSDPMTKALFSLVRAIDDPFDDEAVAYVLHLPSMGLDPLDVYTLIQRARERKKHILSYLKQVSQGLYDTDKYENKDAIIRVYKTIVRWLRIKQKTSPLLLLDAIVRESGILTGGEIDTDLDSWQGIKRIYKELERVYERHTDYVFHDLVLYLEYMRTEGLSVRGGASYIPQNAVRCMTAHRAKGLEFDYVYIVRVYDGHWGNKRTADLLPILPRIYGTRAASYMHNDEDRRLLYVAITRAKKEVTISYARHDDEGRQQLSAEYLEEIRDEVSVRIDVAPTKNTLFSIEQKNTVYEHKDQYIQIKKIVNELLPKKGLSVTALNNYLKCPWQYFYINLLGVPQIQKLHQLYGTAIHAALRDVAIQIKSLKDAVAATAYAQERFERYLRKKPIPAGEYKRWLQRGKTALSAYVGGFYKDFLKAIRAELRIEGVPVTQNVMLRGVIDRLDIEEDGTVLVIDYKTGKHKSPANIEGKTKGSDGGIFRQLVFYKILLDAYEKGRYHMKKGIIAFIEPDEKGVCHAHEFVITNDHTKELIKTIQKSIKEIENLSFWNKRCEDVNCPYCAMHFMMHEEHDRVIL